ncbi:hypothetical protein DEO72_LG10g2817 [Vigna unguiculata]|uniref:Uncharacterized protein n=1 Tax=Vigna unguiculata TaxID=3917 RepID=A0A4D6NFU2_VIGUN|nr:hypothetical protein DEO72_LG10g2817 [Vigna unguiculata]
MLWLYASLDPPATSSTPVYRIHDHRQTQADKEHVRKTSYGPHFVTPGGVSNTNIVRNVPRLPNSLAITEEGNLSGSIRTSHNTHTHIGNTRQPDQQLKGSSCSSTILSHHSRDVILSHNSRNATCLTPISSYKSRDTFRAITQGTSNKPIFKVSPKHCRSCTSKENKASTSALSPDAAPEPPSETRFQTAWQGTRAAKHQAPRSTLTL